MTVTSVPQAWLWAHDIRVDQVDSLLTPGMRLVRLSGYGPGTSGRFAALVFHEPGPPRTYLLGLDAAELEARIRQTGARPVAVTVHPLFEDAGHPQFSIVLETSPGPRASVHTGLDAAEARALLDGRHRIADLDTYVFAGVRRYVVILDESQEQSWLLTEVTAHVLKSALARLGATPVRLRGYTDNTGRRYAAVAEPAPSTGSAWHADLDADSVGKRLERERGYPIDLDATRDERGVRFTVILRHHRSRFGLE